MPQTVRLAGGPPEVQGTPVAELEGRYPLFMIVTDSGSSPYAQNGSVLVRISQSVGYVSNETASGWDNLCELTSRGVRARLPLPDEKIVITQTPGR